ncbi:MAG: acyltransferase, partial [Proteobacteria bacterium]|nr:acyltransferase [Pseudomonadota bacterium]
LRALAILLVIPRHAREVLGGEFFGPFLKGLFNHGWAGVDLFFVLSGFLIGSQLLQSVRRDGKVNFGRFYLKRSLRIMPSFYFVLLIYYIWPAFREKPEIDPAWRFLLYVMNYGRNGEAFSHAWSLCVEEHFYLIFPLLVSICTWRPNWFRPAFIVGGVLIGVTLLRYYLWSQGAPFFPAVYRPSHTHLDGLTVGVTLALLRENRKDLWNRFIAKPWMLFLSGIALVVLSMWSYGNLKEPIGYIFTFTFVSFGFGALVTAAMSPGFWLARIHIPGAATVASLAFTLYLTHKQMIHLAAQIVGDYKNDPFYTIMLSVFLIVAASCIVHFAVERPFLKFRDYLLRRNLTSSRSSVLIDTGPKL